MKRIANTSNRNIQPENKVKKSSSVSPERRREALQLIQKVVSYRQRSVGRPTAVNEEKERAKLQRRQSQYIKLIPRQFMQLVDTPEEIEFFEIMKQTREIIAQHQTQFE